MLGGVRAAMFSIVPYERPTGPRGWPVPATGYSAEMAQASMERALEYFELADQIGFDWVSVAEHHYAPGSLTPNPMVMAGAVIRAGMLRGTSNEYVTYGVNPADLLLVYDAAHAIDGDRPEAFAAAVADFLERHEKFVVRRDSGLLYP